MDKETLKIVVFLCREGPQYGSRICTVLNIHTEVVYTILRRLREMGVVEGSAGAADVSRQWQINPSYQTA